MAMINYTRAGILTSIVDDLTADHIDPPGSGLLKRVTEKMTVRNAKQMREFFPQPALPGIIVVDPSIAQAEGITSGLTGRSAYNKYVTDYRIMLIGLAELRRDQNPQDVVFPIFSAILESLLRPKAPGSSPANSRLSRGGLAITGRPESTAHGGRTQGDRIFFSMGFNFPFEFEITADIP